MRSTSRTHASTDCWMKQKDSLADSRKGERLPEQLVERPNTYCHGSDLSWKDLCRNKPLLDYPVPLLTLESAEKLMEPCGWIGAPMRTESEAVLVDISRGAREHTTAARVGPTHNLTEHSQQAPQLLRVLLGFRQQRGLQESLYSNLSFRNNVFIEYEVKKPH